jgi:hypothetical protein
VFASNSIFEQLLEVILGAKLVFTRFFLLHSPSARRMSVVER